MSRTSVSCRWRKSRIPALRGGGIRRVLARCQCLGDPPAAEQARAVIGDCGLTWSNPIFGRNEADPFVLDHGGHRRGERANLDADFALLLADPVPVADAHRLDR